MIVPEPVASLVAELDQLCGGDYAALAWSEQEVAEYLGESALDALDHPDLVGWLRRTVAFALWWWEKGGRE